MARIVSESVRLPDDLDAHYPLAGELPGELLVPFMGKWRVHHEAAAQFTAFVKGAAAIGIGIVPIPGPGSAYRSLTQQVQLFTQRYTLGAGPNQKIWNGETYHLNPGMAGAATPGSSMHGFGVAIDFMRDNGRSLSWDENKALRAVGAPFTVAPTVKSEAWHWAVQNAAHADGYIPKAIAQPDAAPALTGGQYRDLAVGDAGMDVALVQNIVRDGASQPIDTSDGHYDTRTVDAVKNVQAFFHLPVTGNVDQVTWAVLLTLIAVANPDLAPTNSAATVTGASVGAPVGDPELSVIGGEIVRPTVTELQKILIANGWASFANPDGQFGTNTSNAVKKMQAAFGFPVPEQDGKYGPGTANRLNEFLTARK